MSAQETINIQIKEKFAMKMMKKLIIPAIMLIMLPLSACQKAAPGTDAGALPAASAPVGASGEEYGAFSTMDSALDVLSGAWISANDNYVSFARNADGAVNFSTDLPCPDCDFVDFYEGVLCAFTVVDEDNVEYEKAFNFELVDPDTLRVTCHYDRSTNVFTRIKDTLDDDKLTGEYVFSDNRRAFAFLEGRWEDAAGEYYFSVENVDGALSWNTNLPLDDACESYGFADGGLYGVKPTDAGDSAAVEIYAFEIITQDEIRLTLPDSGDSHILNRIA